MSKSLHSKASRYIPTDSTEEPDFTFTSRTEGGQEIIRSIQSVNHLLNELEFDHNFGEMFADSTVARTLEDARNSKIYESTDKSWREVAYSKLDDSQEKLGKLAHTLMETMEGLLGEGQKQVQCLTDIENLLEMLEKRPARSSPSPQAAKVAASASGKLLKLLIEPQITGKTADKAIQNGRPAEESLLLQDMDRQHYYQMLEAFHSLKYSVEILSPARTIRPQPSKYVERINSEW
jgi:hypothetical protein